MTLDEALARVEIGKTISQTIWTQHPESAGVEPEDGFEYQVQTVITKTGNDSYALELHVLGKRHKE